MDTTQVAITFTELCRAGKLQDASDQFYSDHITSIEAFPGEGSYIVGRDKVAEKSAAWEKENTVHSLEVKGPFINGDSFAVQFTVDCTSAQYGRSVMEEVAVYRVNDGKVVEERFFMLMPLTGQ